MNEAYRTSMEGDLLKIHVWDELDNIERAVSENSLQMAQICLDKIKSNLNTDLEFIPVATFYIHSSDNLLLEYESGIYRNEFSMSLERNLEIFEENEMFEECVEIKKLINQINNL